MAQKVNFQFRIPKPIKGTSPISRTLLQLAPLAIALAREDRTLVSYTNGKAENVAEHSNMLSILAPIIAEEFYPDLDANVVARFAALHDIIEAYVGDTPTHDISDDDLIAKGELEAAGLQQLKKDFAHLPSLTTYVEQYEEQGVAEARFVRVLDKLMPLLVHFNEEPGLAGTTTLKSYIDPAGLLKNSAQKAAALYKKFPEFSALVDARVELSHLAALVLLS